MATKRINRQVILVSRPEGIPDARHFQIVDGEVGRPAEGEVLIQNQYLSVDPAMRGWVSAVPNYSTPVALGEVMRAPAVGTVLASGDPRFGAGDAVVGMFGWQEFACVNAGAVFWKIEELDLPLSYALGALGLSGITAYFGLLEVGRPRSGETVVVSTAAGSVGSIVGQIARIEGARTIGIAGGAAKAEMCRQRFGFDAAIDYKAETDIERALSVAAPDGVDVYFDNTSGPVSDAVLKHLNAGARVIVCGTASIASWDPPPLGPRIERHILVKRARVEGFLVFDYADRYAEARRHLADWVRADRIRVEEDVLPGLEAAPGAIAGLYRGENVGKRLISLGI